tara:strand:- start:1088 stop:1204 length:117 start_codon:yes stop_codon:yes gene_type:complete
LPVIYFGDAVPEKEVKKLSSIVKAKSGQITDDIEYVGH